MFHMLITWCGLFVQKMPLKTNQPTDHCFNSRYSTWTWVSQFSSWFSISIYSYSMGQVHTLRIPLTQSHQICLRRPFRLLPSTLNHHRPHTVWHGPTKFDKITHRVCRGRFLQVDRFTSTNLFLSTNLFHHSPLAPTWTAFSDYTGPDLLCSTVFHF